MPEEPPERAKGKRPRRSRRVRRKIARIILLRHQKIHSRRYRPFRVKET
jgi:hypothetical protein